MTEEELPEFKIVFVGDANVGKTSIIVRYHLNTFSEESQATIGAAFITKVVKSKYGYCKIHVWDTAGQERYKSLVPMYARGSYVTVIVFDVTDPDAFSTVKDWAERVKKDISKDCQIIIAGNKFDLTPQFNREEIEEFAKKENCTLIYVSAKSTFGMDLLFNTIVSKLPEANFLLKETESMEIDNVAVEKKNGGCC